MSSAGKSVSSRPFDNSAPSSSTIARKPRNVKRGRISSLIRERAEKKKALAAAESNTPTVAAVKKRKHYSNKDATSLSITDPRFNYSRMVLDALNTCDIVVVEEMLKKYCAPDIISYHLYIGELDHNPLGPNSRILIGYDAILEVWRDWFKIAPDNVYVHNNTRATIDQKTGVTVSSTNYTCHFTRVLEGSPVVSDEEIKRVEALRQRLRCRKRVKKAASDASGTSVADSIIDSSAESLLDVVENNVQHIAEWKQGRGGSAKEFLQQTLKQQGPPCDDCAAADEAIFGDATEAEIKSLLDSFLDDMGGEETPVLLKFNTPEEQTEHREQSQYSQPEPGDRSGSDGHAQSHPPAARGSTAFFTSSSSSSSSSFSSSSSASAPDITPNGPPPVEQSATGSAVDATPMGHLTAAPSVRPHSSSVLSKSESSSGTDHQSNGNSMNTNTNSSNGNRNATNGKVTNGTCCRAQQPPQPAPTSSSAADKGAANPPMITTSPKPLLKKEIVTCTYIGTFSVEINPNGIIPTMNFSFSVKVGDQNNGEKKAVRSGVVTTTVE